MPLVLDTDHLTVLQRRQQPGCDRLLARLERVPADDVAVTIISFQEQIQGWLAFLSRARSATQIVRAYTELEAIMRSFSKMNVLSFGQEAQTRFTHLRGERLRVATMDLRIASIALATDSTLLSCNLQDFRRVPGLSVEDWTR